MLPEGTGIPILQQTARPARLLPFEGGDMRESYDHSSSREYHQPAPSFAPPTIHLEERAGRMSVALDSGRIRATTWDETYRTASSSDYHYPPHPPYREEVEHPLPISANWHDSFDGRYHHLPETTQFRAYYEMPPHPHGHSPLLHPHQVPLPPSPLSYPPTSLPYLAPAPPQQQASDVLPSSTPLLTQYPSRELSEEWETTSSVSRGPSRSYEWHEYTSPELDMAVPLPAVPQRDSPSDASKALAPRKVHRRKPEAQNESRRRPYICELCPDTKFARPSALRVHMLTHTKERPHACPHPECGKSFTVASNLKRHYKLHLAGRPIRMSRKEFDREEKDDQAHSPPWVDEAAVEGTPFPGPVHEGTGLWLGESRH